MGRPEDVITVRICRRIYAVRQFLRRYIADSVRVSRWRRRTFGVLRRVLRRLLRRRWSLPDDWIDNRSQPGHKTNA